MSDFKAGEKPILYEVVKDGFRYITTGTPDGTEESIAEYRRADLPLTLEQLNSDPRVQALVGSLEWFLSEDETNTGDEPMREYGGRSWDEMNSYWITGNNKARSSLLALTQIKDPL
jgi:hypothetical protein